MNQNIVTETSKNIRALARVSLQGKWKLAVIATAVYMIALMVPATILDIIFGGEDGVSLLSGLYTFLVTAPFTVGYSIFCLNLFRRKECEVAQVFYGFEKFFKVIGLYIVMCVFIGLWIIAPIIAALITQKKIFFLLILPLGIPAIIAAYRYSQSFLIMADHPEYGIMQCISESKRIMIGNKLKFFCMEFSFIGWAILAAIPTGILSTIFTFAAPSLKSMGSLIGSIAYFWLMPYMCLAGVAFYELANGNLLPGVIEASPMSFDGETSKLSEVPYNTEGEVHTTEETREN
ncbi:DUF975 family protein [Aminipila sp.]|uniref:DUF975 family protein n=1 Tax=Aminipila sp. TaxID=2060095 RepID=UPI00289A17D9|nr:DUF975 family protein [Aminipila sp.]